MGHATLERVRLFGTRSADYIRASGHSGCIATEVVLQAKQAEYMTAPERFAEMPDFSLAPRAPSIHDPQRNSAGILTEIRSAGGQGKMVITLFVLLSAE